jgi:uroporphyrinogen-III synthase
MSGGTLSGVGVLITRPLPQAQTLAEKLREVGGVPVVFPGIEIEQIEGPQLAAALREAMQADLVVFVSPTAARIGMNLLANADVKPARAKFAAVGRGTATELNGRGAGEIIAPRDGHDSEALARHPALQRIRGNKVVIFRGQGGREYLATVLRERGARVVLAECYRRLRPRGQFSLTLPDWASGRIAAWTASSAQIVDNLFAIAGVDGSEWLRRRVVFVPHARIAACAFRHGAHSVFVTGPGDSGLLSGLETWFGRLRRTTAQQAT